MVELCGVRYDSLVIHYGEITLKRSRRGRFERILWSNLERFTGLPVRRIQGRFVVDLDPEIDLENLLERVGKVFGVVWYAPAVRASSLDELQEKLLRILARIKPRSLKVEVRRSDKRFPMTSLEVSRKLGYSLSSKLGAGVDLKNPEKRVFVEITEDGIYASLVKLKGPGGLPLGSSGKTLGLFSGGVKSALACWFMMKRGCKVDLLHVHGMASGGEALENYLKHNIDKLLEYSLRLRLYLAPFKPFLDRVKEVSTDALLQLLQAFMLRLGELIAEKKGYLGLVLGVSIREPSQVKSLSTVLSLRRLPVYTPLLALADEEIRRRAETLGFVEITGEDKLDPLEYVRKNSGGPSGVDLKTLRKLWKRYDVDGLVKHSLESLEIYELRLDQETKKIR